MTEAGVLEIGTGPWASPRPGSLPSGCGMPSPDGQRCRLTGWNCSPRPPKGKQVSCSLGVGFLLLLTMSILQQSISIIKQKAQGESVGQWRMGGVEETERALGRR